MFGEFKCNVQQTISELCSVLDKRNIFLKPAAHDEERTEQTASLGGLLSRFFMCAGKFWRSRDLPREAMRIK